VFVAEASQQQAPRVVVSYDSNRQYVDPEVGKIVHRIGAAAGDDSALTMPQDEYWGLTGDAGDFAEDEFVRHHVAENRHSDAGECGHDLPQAVHFFGGAGHDEANNLQCDFLTAMACDRESHAK
jgi:hypothetical protein